MAASPRMTHKGWFWFCPIYLAFDGDESSGTADVEARHAWLEPLFTLAEWLESARIWLTSMLLPDYEPSFMFTVTGELSETRSLGV